ncbi:Bug family tripartite tricarboxylate transporter substrate binding protein [Rhodoplanes sp. Z2-YC6860]|uniref:Bug family tripartite tricarboxylate transporter substrate binding protein n=1 Tax=Rhodoplanes sp. Z2-YC6860 TaxID=674703 RepID=UPI00078DDAA2|nr:tripartite tricarboxylate transporter substrate binding protein [Rhodoplanes sp. Z2-YC6860]AMN43183.1 extra-cytoplasmic solute receptor protein [Rhodoplanes sp. Z2-YC6860]
MNFRQLMGSLALCALMALPAGPSFADDYPSRPVTIIVPYAAGGVTDVLARLVAQKLGERLGKPFLIENKGGAGTIVAAVSTAKSAPDGYTLMMATGSTMSINRTLYKSLPYDPDTDLTPVSLVCSVPFVLVTNPSLPVNNVSDLIKLAKEKPGTLNYGTGGVGSTVSILVYLMQSMTGVKMTEVPYRGTTPAMTDTIAGNVQFMFNDTASIAPLVKDGKLKALGISSAKRFEGTPDIPTIAEAGIPGFEGDSWQMLVAPAKTPKEIVDKLNAAINEVVNSPEIKSQMLKLGMAATGKGKPEELTAYVKSETARWGKVVTDAGYAHTQ